MYGHTPEVYHLSLFKVEDIRFFTFLFYDLR